MIRIDLNFGTQLFFECINNSKPKNCGESMLNSSPNPLPLSMTSAQISSFPFYNLS